jgi:hypothetical protein
LLISAGISSPTSFAEGAGALASSSPDRFAIEAIA